jgi:hypothetical protein
MTERSNAAIATVRVRGCIFVKLKRTVLSSTDPGQRESCTLEGTALERPTRPPIHFLEDGGWSWVFPGYSPLGGACVAAVIPECGNAR